MFVICSVKVCRSWQRQPLHLLENIMIKYIYNEQMKHVSITAQIWEWDTMLILYFRKGEMLLFCLMHLLVMSLELFLFLLSNNEWFTQEIQCYFSVLDLCPVNIKLFKIIFEIHSFQISHSVSHSFSLSWGDRVASILKNYCSKPYPYLLKWSNSVCFPKPD